MVSSGIDYVKLGNMLKTAREGLELTQRQVADYLGLTPQNVSSWERGKSKIDIETLFNLCNKYGLNFSGLLSEVAYNENAPSSDIEPGASIEEVLYTALLRMGYIVPGKRMSKADEEFLSSLLSLTAAYFGKKKEESE